jgi:ribosome recycling factor
MIETLKPDLKNKMYRVLESLLKDFSGLRTGRASTNLIENITVDAYGNKTPVNQLGTVTSQDNGKLLVVQTWDKSVVKPIEKAINDADLGVTASSEGQIIRVPIPPLSEERRKEIVKLASKYSEQSKVSIRNVRREGMDKIKQAEKNTEISEDKMHTESAAIQKITDEYVKNIDELLVKKEKEITTI